MLFLELWGRVEDYKKFTFSGKFSSEKGTQSLGQSLRRSR